MFLHTHKTMSYALVPLMENVGHFSPLRNMKIFDLQMMIKVSLKLMFWVKTLSFWSADVLASQEHSGEIATVTIDQRKYFCQKLINTLNCLQVWRHDSVLCLIYSAINGTTVIKSLDSVAFFNERWRMCSNIQSEAFDFSVSLYWLKDVCLEVQKFLTYILDDRFSSLLKKKISEV